MTPTHHPASKKGILPASRSTKSMNIDVDRKQSNQSQAEGKHTMLDTNQRGNLGFHDRNKIQQLASIHFIYTFTENAFKYYCCLYGRRVVLVAHPVEHNTNETPLISETNGHRNQTTVWVEWQVWKVHFSPMRPSTSHAHKHTAQSTKEIKDVYMKLSYRHLPKSTIDIKWLLDLTIFDRDTNVSPLLYSMLTHRAWPHMWRIFQQARVSLSCLSSSHNRDLDGCYSYRKRE